MALCSTGALLLVEVPLEAEVPLRLLAGAAETEAASKMDRVEANRLAIRVVFITWISVIGGAPVRMDPRGH